LLRQTLPAHFRVEERSGGFFSGLADRGIPRSLLDRLRIEHRDMLGRLEDMREKILAGQSVDQDLHDLADLLREHEWLESAYAATVHTSPPGDSPAEAVPTELLPAKLSFDIAKVAERCRALAEQSERELFGGVTVAAPATVSAELVRIAMEDALDDRALPFARVQVVIGPADRVELREVTLRSPSEPRRDSRAALERSAAPRAALEARLAALLRRSAKIDHHLRGRDGRLELDPADASSLLANDEVLEGLDEAAHREIGEIRDALERLARGSWGLCDQCGERILAQRLAVLPHTRLCADCAAEEAS